MPTLAAAPAATLAVHQQQHRQRHPWCQRHPRRNLEFRQDKGDNDNDDGDNDNDDGDNDHDDDNMMVAIPEAGSFLFFAFLDFVLLVNFGFSEI